MLNVLTFTVGCTGLLPLPWVYTLFDILTCTGSLWGAIAFALSLNIFWCFDMYCRFMWCYCPRPESTLHVFWYFGLYCRFTWCYCLLPESSPWVWAGEEICSSYRNSDHCTVHSYLPWRHDTANHEGNNDR